jgi:hypothetical protein
MSAPPNPAGAAAASASAGAASAAVIAAPGGGAAAPSRPQRSPCSTPAEWRAQICALQAERMTPELRAELQQRQQRSSVA